MVLLNSRINHIYREITPLNEYDCFLIFDRSIKAFTFPIHFHPEFEITYISNAKGAKRVVGDNVEEISNKELVIIGPNLYHGWENHKNDLKKNIHLITIQFPRDLFAKTLINRNLLKPIHDLLTNANRGILFSNETTRHVESKLFALSNKRGFDSYLEFQSLLYDLAISRDQRLLTNITFQLQNDFYNSKRIEKVYNYINENYNRRIKVKDAAQLINMSVVSFSRFMKQRTGKSFVDFVNDIRLGNATRALIETNKSVSEIGFDCGFNNMSNFNRIFKKKQNCTPSEFRDSFVGVKNVY